MKDILENNQPDGFRLLEENRYDEAIAYFLARSRESGNPHIPYGLGTALFRKGGPGLSVDELLHIVLCYRKATAIDTRFADAYLMGGMALMALLAALLKGSNNAHSLADPNILSVPRLLEEAEQSFQKAMKCNPQFSDPARAHLNQIYELQKHLSA